MTLILFVLTIITVTGASWLCLRDSLFRVMMSLALQSDLLSHRYYGEVSPEQIFADAWRGMQRAIPFAVELSTSSTAQAGKKTRIDWGLTVEHQDSIAIIRAVSLSSPLYAALAANDTLVGVGESGANVPVTLGSYLDAQVGNPMAFYVRRGGLVDTIVANLEQAPDTTFADFEMMPDKILYILAGIRDHTAVDRITAMLCRAEADAIDGVIIDCRDAQLYDRIATTKLVDVLVECLGQRRLAVIVDSTTDAAVATGIVPLTELENCRVFGTHVMNGEITEELITLQTGHTLLVSRPRNNRGRLTVVHQSDSVALAGDLSAETDYVITPDVECTRPSMSGVVFQLVHGGYIREFVISNRFSALPARDDEIELFREFTSFVAERGFRYDPLTDAARELRAHRADAETRRLIKSIADKAAAQRQPDLFAYREEITRQILIAVHRTWIGGQLSPTNRMRLYDNCLQIVYDNLRTRSI